MLNGFLARLLSEEFAKDTVKYPRKCENNTIMMKYRSWCAEKNSFKNELLISHKAKILPFSCPWFMTAVEIDKKR